LVAVYFLLGGIGHFLFADYLVAIVPSYIPFQKLLIFIIGFFEILGAMGLLWPFTRVLAAYCLIAICVAIFPVNINMALHDYLFAEIPKGVLYLVLPFQPALIAFIWWAIKDERVSKKRTKQLNKMKKLHSLEQRCLAIAADVKPFFEWTWDERYSLIMAEFKKEKERDIYPILASHFENEWDVDNIIFAPELIIQKLKKLGGIQADQKVLSTEVRDGSFLCCLIWPWADNKTDSIRIVSVAKNENDEDFRERMANFKTWFTIKHKGSGWVKVNPS